MKLGDLIHQRAAWLPDGGRDSDVVVSSRARLARNLNGYGFVGRATDLDLENLKETARAALENVLDKTQTTYLDFADLSRDEARFLMERRLVSREFVSSKRPRALFFQNDESFSVMINEEDHLRIQATTPGFSLEEAWKRVGAIDDKIESALSYAFDDHLGYLTASPDNVGCGLRVSVMLHLPALVETHEISKAVRGVQQMNLIVGGFNGEDSKPFGRFFQISNHASLGVSEEELIDRFAQIIPDVVEYERQVRQAILDEDRDGFVDRCYRALGLLASARSMSMKEAMKRLSYVRLGTRMGALPESITPLVDELILQIQTSHLQRLVDAPTLDKADEEARRASFLRSKLKDFNKK